MGSGRTSFFSYIKYNVVQLCCLILVFRFSSFCIELCFFFHFIHEDIKERTFFVCYNDIQVFPFFFLP